MKIIFKMNLKMIYHLLFLLSFIFVSCEESRMSNEGTINDLEIKRRELVLKEKEIKKKEDELLKQNEKNIEEKKNEFSQEINTNVNIEGRYEGSIKDGTYWTVYIDIFNGKKFDGYNVIYWKKSPDGFRTNFSGEYNSSDNSITIYEDRKAKGSGTFYGKVSSDEKTISGVWNRYSDGGSFTWNLTKVNN